MSRIRTYKPEFFASEDVASLPFRARLTWLGLWPHCDDHGRSKDNVKLIKANVWPLDQVSLREVEDDLTVLADQGRIVRYIVGGKPLLAVVNWHFHQNINRPGAPVHPAPPLPMPTPAPGEQKFCPFCWTDFTTHGGLTEGSPVDKSTVDESPGQGDSDDSVSAHGGLTLGKEGKGREGRGRVSAPPNPNCLKHKNDPHPPPCRACGEARLAAQAWEAEHVAEQRTAIRGCRMCDGEGFRWDPAGRHRGPTRDRCDHRPLAVVS